MTEPTATRQGLLPGSVWLQKHPGLAGVEAALRGGDSGRLAGAAPAGGCALALPSPSLLAPRHGRLSQDTVCSRNRACVCSGRPTGPCSAPRSLSRPDKGPLCPQLPLPHSHRPQGSHRVPHPPRLRPRLLTAPPTVSPLHALACAPSLSLIPVPDAPDSPHPACPLGPGLLDPDLRSRSLPRHHLVVHPSAPGPPPSPPLCPTQGGRPS